MPAVGLRLSSVRATDGARPLRFGPGHSQGETMRALCCLAALTALATAAHADTTKYPLISYEY